MLVRCTVFLWLSVASEAADIVEVVFAATPADALRQVAQGCGALEIASAWVVPEDSTMDDLQVYTPVEVAAL